MANDDTKLPAKHHINLKEEDGTPRKSLKLSPAPDTSTTVAQQRQDEGSGRGAARQLPIDRLKNHFAEKMKDDRVPLLSSWEGYKKMLPVRETKNNGGSLVTKIIAECPFWANEQDVKKMTMSLEAADQGRGERIVLPYLSAPSHSGKTASILVGFLNSCESDREVRFTHYLYLPFANNLGRHFAYDVEEGLPQRKQVNERQGAHFAFQCAQCLLEEGPLNDTKFFQSPPDAELPTFQATVDKMAVLVKSKLAGDKPMRVLFHADEHRKMNTENEHFRRGAMEALASCGKAVCVATYTDIPSEIAPKGSSNKVCRSPVTKPVLNMFQVFSNVQKLNIFSLLNNDTERLWAGLVFRMALYIGPRMLRIHSGLEETFLDAFDNARKDSDKKEAVKRCIRLCRSNVSMQSSPQQNALKLMTGIREDQLNNMEFKLPSVTVVNNFIYGTLDSLLDCYDPDCPIYTVGRNRFVNAINGSEDLLAPTPLEAAYGWSLSCQAVARQMLSFAPKGFEFQFEPKLLQSGRLFKAQDNQKLTDLVTNAKKEVFYYADEEPPKQSHPLCHFWFVNDSDQLVLIEVTGGLDVPASDEMMNKMELWMQTSAATESLQQYQKFGIVLAPGEKGPNVLKGNVCAVKGKDAQLLLGGLSQCWEWLVPL